MQKRCGEDIKGKFVSMTYDAFAKNILDHFLYALPDKLRHAPDYLVDDFKTIDAAFKTVEYGNPVSLSQSKLKAKYDALLSQISLLLTGNDRAWPLLLKGSNGNKATLKFKMIMMLAMNIVKINPYIKRALQMTYKFH